MNEDQKIPSDLELLDRLGGDRELLEEIAGLSLQHWPRLIVEMREAISIRNPAALKRAAHKLKASVGIFFSDGPYAATEELEDMGRRGELQNAPEAFAKLNDGLSQLCRQFLQYARPPQESLRP